MANTQSPGLQDRFPPAGPRRERCGPDWQRRWSLDDAHRLMMRIGVLLGFVTAAAGFRGLLPAVGPHVDWMRRGSSFVVMQQGPVEPRTVHPFRNFAGHGQHVFADIKLKTHDPSTLLGCIPASQCTWYAPQS